MLDKIFVAYPVQGTAEEIWSWVCCSLEPGLCLLPAQAPEALPLCTVNPPVLWLMWFRGTGGLYPNYIKGCRLGTVI